MFMEENTLKILQIAFLLCDYIKVFKKMEFPERSTFGLF